MAERAKMLITGASGYVGPRLVPHLLDRGNQVRVLVRDAQAIAHLSWFSQVEVCVGDIGEPSQLRNALCDIHVAYYLIHSMTSGKGFPHRDIELAGKFGEIARDSGVRSIIYLGGLGDPDANLSEHLRSRQETGEALRSGGVPVTEFRAAVIVGAGSISFEMIRHLTERIPIMICPRWVFKRIQPIAIDDVLCYLVAALDLSGDENRIVEIGGADIVTYGRMIKDYARIRGLKRVLFPVPVLTPNLSSYWVHWVTPIRATFARPLIEGLRSDVIVQNHDARILFPDIHPMGYDEALRRAMDELQPQSFHETVEAILEQSVSKMHLREIRADRGMIMEVWQTVVRARHEAVFGAFSSLGGRRGWLSLDWAWRLRAFLDTLFGGVGMRSSQTQHDTLHEGDTLDFFRVEKIKSGRFLRLHVEMKLPGAGWLQFEARPVNEGMTRLVQIVYYAPRGLLGLLYWYLLNPSHRMIFSGLLRQLTKIAERNDPHDRTSVKTNPEDTNGLSG
ncbi:MAG: DUF2867 domain-containing protein [Sedimentisphaerales bacterium]|nr:DUF2867 domain-containing protein [Sedimentisphaerales bacterium]